jgi:hypothetical protein
VLVHHLIQAYRKQEWVQVLSSMQLPHNQGTFWANLSISNSQSGNSFLMKHSSNLGNSSKLSQQLPHSLRQVSWDRRAFRLFPAICIQRAKSCNYVQSKGYLSVRINAWATSSKTDFLEIFCGASDIHSSGLPRKIPNIVLQNLNGSFTNITTDRNA